MLWVLAALTMTVGNVTALVQRNIKRMLAYSSIAHAGYLLVGMVAGGEAGGSAVLFYLIGYAFMTLGAFAVVIALGRRGQPNENLDDYAGVGFRSPFLGAAMAVFMLSLSGIPPLAGFVGKFYIFSAAVKSGYVGLAIIGVLNSVVSVYYYVGVLVRMYMTEGDHRGGGAQQPAVPVCDAAAHGERHHSARSLSVVTVRSGAPVVPGAALSAPQPESHDVGAGTPASEAHPCGCPTRWAQ